MRSFQEARRLNADGYIAVPFQGDGDGRTLKSASGNTDDHAGRKTVHLDGEGDRHVEGRALGDLNVKGRGAKSPWVQVMAARKRKTLVVCRPCHLKAHDGNWNPQQQR